MIQFYKHYLASISDRLPLSLSVQHADGTIQKVGAGGPEVELRFHSTGLYHRLLLNPSLAFGEGYAAGKITLPTDNLFQLFRGLWATEATPVITQNLRKVKSVFRWLSRGNTLRKALYNAQAHYDKFHRIVNLAVDEQTRLYSCAFFKNPRITLTQAQTAKTERTLAKLALQPGQNVLEIGCGYGYIARAAARCGAKVTAITLSNEQYRVAKELASTEDLSVNFLKADYRTVSGRFNAIYSVAMYEAVGRRHWTEFFTKVAGVLERGGSFLLHTVTQPFWQPMDTLIDAHVFPGSELPTPKQVLSAAERNGLLFHHAESWKPHYCRTLLQWLNNLRNRKEEALNLFDSVLEGGWYYRLWEVYLAGCAASFAGEEGMDLHQFVFSNGKADWDARKLEL